MSDPPRIVDGMVPELAHVLRSAEGGDVPPQKSGTGKRRIRAAVTASSAWSSATSPAAAPRKAWHKAGWLGAAMSMAAIAVLSVRTLSSAPDHRAEAKPSAVAPPAIVTTSAPLETSSPRSEHACRRSPGRGASGSRPAPTDGNAEACCSSPRQTPKTSSRSSIWHVKLLPRISPRSRSRASSVTERRSRIPASAARPMRSTSRRLLRSVDATRHGPRRNAPRGAPRFSIHAARALGGRYVTRWRRRAQLIGHQGVALEAVARRKRRSSSESLRARGARSGDTHDRVRLLGGARDALLSAAVRTTLGLPLRSPIPGPMGGRRMPLRGMR